MHPRFRIVSTNPDLWVEFTYYNSQRRFCFLTFVEYLLQNANKSRSLFRVPVSSIPLHLRPYSGFRNSKLRFLISTRLLRTLWDTISESERADRIGIRCPLNPSSPLPRIVNVSGEHRAAIKAVTEKKPVAARIAGEDAAQQLMSLRGGK